jgi:transcriptional regulator with XRE-family HTH domain
VNETHIPDRSAIDFGGLRRRYANPGRLIAQIKLELAQTTYTQIDLARVSGVNYHLLNRWFNGHVQPGLENLMYLDEGMGRLTEMWAIDNREA